jgi:general stress protein 26
MDKEMQEFILKLLERGRDLTIATIRPDGYPQATTVSYANDGMTIYVGIGKNSQKAKNIRACNKVSLTVNNDYEDWDHIQGLSIGADAEILQDESDIRQAGECILKRFPQVAQWANNEHMQDIALLRIRPKVISVLDYQKGFGHTDLVTV